MSIPEKAQVSNWKEYKVVCIETEGSFHAISSLDDRVNEMINDGWQPLGGLAIRQWELGDTLVCQAMVKD